MRKKNLLEISYVVTCELQTTGIAILTIGSCANTQIVCPESQLGFQVQSAEAQHGLSFKTKLKTQVSFYHIEKTKEGKNKETKKTHLLWASQMNEWLGVLIDTGHFWCSVYWLLLKHHGPQTFLKFSEVVFLAEASISATLHQKSWSAAVKTCWSELQIIFFFQIVSYFFFYFFISKDIYWWLKYVMIW